MNKSLCFVMAMTMACLTSSLAVAGEYGSSDTRAWHHKDDHHGMIMGKHGMEGTVESVDLKTGWVHVKTGEGSMTVHFPPDSIKDLKAGDAIKVYLSFSKGAVNKGGMMDHDKMTK
ncbi:MAG TPA: hypothetical protein VIU46_07065 [Gallionellaceae bacterium]